MLDHVQAYKMRKIQGQGPYKGSEWMTWHGTVVKRTHVKEQGAAKQD